MIKWIKADIIPEFNSEENHYGSPTFLISDGESVSIGWYEPEYIADNPKDPLQYSDAMWHDDAGILCEAEVKYYAEIPIPPKEDES